MTSKETVHTFAGNPLDRGDAEVRDDQWLETAMQDPTSRVLPFWRQRVLVSGNTDQVVSPAWQQDWQNNHHENKHSLTFLGVVEGKAHFAVDLTTEDTRKDDPPPELDGEFMDCRAAAMSAPAHDAAIIGQARASLEWQRNHAHCGRCGANTTIERGGRLRVCSSCNARHRPRTDPVVIMLITNGDNCLLGQPNSRMVANTFYTALAGFVDQGESIEEAVRRECLEEANIRVGNVTYHSSQPWPFPYSLMIGCHGEASTTDIKIDPHEMQDVRWFSHAEAKTALAGNGDIRVPGDIAIAHHLIKDWVEDPTLGRT